MAEWPLLLDGRSGSVLPRSPPRRGSERTASREPAGGLLRPGRRAGCVRDRADRELRQGQRACTDVERQAVRLRPVDEGQTARGQHQAPRLRVLATRVVAAGDERQRVRGAVEKKGLSVASRRQHLHVLDLGKPPAEAWNVVLPRARYRPLTPDRLGADVLVGPAWPRRGEAEVQGRLNHAKAVLSRGCGLPASRGNVRGRSPRTPAGFVVGDCWGATGSRAGTCDRGARPASAVDVAASSTPTSRARTRS